MENVKCKMLNEKVKVRFDRLTVTGYNLLNIEYKKRMRFDGLLDEPEPVELGWMLGCWALVQTRRVGRVIEPIACFEMNPEGVISCV